LEKLIALDIEELCGAYRRMARAVERPVTT
jgi:hypothetical protein